MENFFLNLSIQIVDSLTAKDISPWENWRNSYLLSESAVDNESLDVCHSSTDIKLDRMGRKKKLDGVGPIDNKPSTN